MRFSIIIPTFNRKELVLRAVRSALSQQSCQGFEVVVSDDGSTDGTPQKVREEFKAEIDEQKLRVLDSTPSADPAAARNRGARAAQGEWLAFLDSDDYWKEGRLLRLEVMSDSTDVILGVGSDSNIPFTQDPVDFLISGNWAMTSASAIRKSWFERLRGFSEGYYGKPQARRIGWEDYELWLRAVLHAEKTGCLNRIVFPSAHDVAFEPQPEGAGRVLLRNQMSREAMTLLRVLPQIRPKHWTLLTRRLLGATKAIALGR